MGKGKRLQTFLSLMFGCLSGLYGTVVHAAEPGAVESSSAKTTTAAAEIRIALRAHRGVEKGMAKWQATADHLSRSIPGYRFTIVPFKHNAALNQAVSQGSFHFVLTNPAATVSNSINYGTKPLATLVNKRQGKGYMQFGSVIFVRADRADINTLEDLRGKVFMAVDEFGFGGWRVAWQELLRNDINPHTDFREVQYGGGVQQNVVYAVRDGKVDAGSVRTDMLERMARKKEIRLEDFKVLNLKYRDDFPFLLSTRLYPEWGFSQTRSASNELAVKVLNALQAIEPTSVAAKKGKYLGWVQALDYTPVRQLMQELQVGPYQHQRTNLFQQALQLYWVYILAGVLFLAVLLILVIYLVRANQKLVQAFVSGEAQEELGDSRTDDEVTVQREQRLLFENLRTLTELFNVRYGMISLISRDTPGVMQTLLVYSDGKLLPNFEYKLHGTPCEDILNCTQELVAEAAQEKYPSDTMLRDLGIESYYGMPIKNVQGEVCGLVAVMDTRPLHLEEWVSPLLSVFVKRMALNLVSCGR